MTDPATIRRAALEEAATLIETFRDEMAETVASAGLRFQLAAGIRALADGPGEDGWQPIETAPTDGTEILICGGTIKADSYEGDGWPFRGVAIVTRDDDSWRGEHEETYDNWYRHEPTHWRPLPSPPKGETT